MTWFASKEASGGAPHWLLTLTRAGRVSRLTFSNAPVVVGLTGVGYAPAIAGRDRLERNPEPRAATVTMRVGRTTPLADALRETRTHPFRALLEKYHGGDDTAPPVVECHGAVANVRLARGWVYFDVVLSESLFALSFPTKLIERTCQWPAFSPESGIDERAFSYDTTIDDIAGSVVTVASTGLSYEKYYNSGQLRFGADASADRVFVDYHVGTEFHLVDALPDAVLDAFDAFVNDGGPAVPVTLIAGDDKTFKTRRDRFGADAVDRFLGFDNLPVSDPLQTGLRDAPIAFAPYTGASAPAPATPSPSGGLPFRTFPTLTETDLDGTVSLGVDDPDGMISAVEYRTNPTGFAGDWSAWDDAGFSSTPPTYLAAVTKGAGGFGAIEIRVTYDDGSGPETQTGHWEFARPFYDVGRVTPNIDDAGEVILEKVYPGGASYRAFFTPTADVQLWPTLQTGQTARLFLDASAGPWTLTFRTATPEGITMQYFAQPGSVPITSLVVDGLCAVDVARLYGDDPQGFDVTIVTGDVTPL